MAILSITHPDFLEFLRVKLDRKELTNFNISVAITKPFLEAVENNDEWYFTFGGRQNKYFVYEIKRISEEGNDVVEVVAKDEEDALGRAQLHKLKHYSDTFEAPKKKKIFARDLWTRIVDNAIESGEPGIFNIDFANEYTNVSYFEHMPSTNPCGEEVLPAYGNCCLGHVNLANMVDVDGVIDCLLAQFVRGYGFLITYLRRIISRLRNARREECDLVGLDWESQDFTTSSLRQDFDMDQSRAWNSWNGSSQR
jgi:ribonucleoside-diphosphate reductase alpha chain